MIKFGNKVLVSDPGYKYDNDDRYVAVLNNVQPGNYNTIVKIGDENSDSWTRGRVTHLLAIHEEYTEDDCNWIETEYSIGVDSGQCGIYDFDSVKDVIGHGDYDDKNSWYGKACSLTYDETNRDFMGGEIDGYGVVSSAGFGDGVYRLSIATNNEIIVGIKLIYIEDRDYDTELDWEEEEYYDDDEDEDEVPDYDEEDDSDLD